MGYQHLGIDRSSNNHLNTNQAAWKEAHDFLTYFGGGAQPFLVEKLGEGEGYANPNEHPEIVVAREVGFAYAGYGFAHLDRDTPAGEVGFWKVHNPDNLKVEEDYEVGLNGTLDKALAELADLGNASLAYTFPDEMKVLVAHVPASKRWLADYSGKASPEYPCLIWQDTDKLNVPGGLGVCDGNRFMSTEAQFNATFSGVTLHAA